MSVLWRGDYDTGSPYQWADQQFETPFPTGHNFSVVTDRRRASYGYAGRFEVQPGDNAGLSKERTEVASQQLILAGGTEELTRYYGWSTYFDSTLWNPTPGTGSTNIFTQWHEGPPARLVPPVRFYLEATSAATILTTPLRCKVAGGWNGTSHEELHTYELGLPTWDAWNDFVLGIKWSATAGWVQIWRDGAQVLAQTTQKTMYAGQGVYAKQGFYRTPSAETSVIWHDGFTEGTTKADVEPVISQVTGNDYRYVQRLSKG